MTTLKEYIEDQRKLGATPYFTNLPPGEGGPEDAFRYDEDEFTAATEKELEDPLSGFSYSEDVPGLIPEEPQEFSMAEAKRKKGIPPKPTAETVTPGARVPGEKTARYAMDQKIPKAKEAVPKKPSAEELTPDFKNRARYEKQVAGRIEREYGFDPRTFNYVEEAAKQTQEREPDLFRKTFGGRKAYHMKDLLDPREKRAWNAAVEADAAMTENKLKFTSDQINKQLKGSMDLYDEKTKEKAKLPVTMKQNLEGLFITVNEDGKKVGQIPPAVLPKAVVRAEKYINGGMSSAEAGSKVTQEIMQETIQLQATRQAKVDSLAAIPGPGSWGMNPKEQKAAKTAGDAALKAGATMNEVKAAYLDRGYTELHIAKIYPPGAGETAVVSRETKTEPGTVIGTLGGKEVRTLNDIARIVKEDPTQREAGKALYAKLRK